MQIPKGTALIRGRLFEIRHWLEEVWYSLIMSKQFFLKKAASHATLSFLLYIDICKIKNVQPLLLYFAGDGCLLSFYLSVCLSVSVSVSVSLCLSLLFLLQIKSRSCPDENTPYSCDKEVGTVINLKYDMTNILNWFR